MDLQAQIRASFAATMTAHPSLVVAVVSGSETANGVRSTTVTDASLVAAGETGTTSGLVRVSAAALTEPAKGAAITVGGEEVFVTGTRLDAVGGLLAIEYSERREFEGE